MMYYSRELTFIIADAVAAVSAQPMHIPAQIRNVPATIPIINWGGSLLFLMGTPGEPFEERSLLFTAAVAMPYILFIHFLTQIIASL